MKSRTSLSSYEKLIYGIVMLGFLSFGIAEAQDEANLRNTENLSSFVQEDLELDRNRNISKIEVLLDDSTKDDTIFDLSDAVTASITTLGAIGGGITGAYFTYRNATKIEDRKDERELKKQKEYNRDMKSLVDNELKECKKFVLKIRNTNPDERPIIANNIKNSFIFTNLPVEKKLQVMDPDSLSITELTYRKFYDIVDSIIQDKYFEHKEGLISEFMGTIDIAISKVESINKSI
jgi:hypothetical protein